MRQLIRRLRRFTRDQKGLAALEFAFIAPVLLLIYFGAVDLTNWYMAHRRLVVAGSTIADLTTQNPGTVTGAQINQYWTAIGDIIAPLNLADVSLTMRDYRKDGGSAKRQWGYNKGTACSGTPDAAALLAIATSEMSEANDILVAEVCTTMQPMVLSFFNFPAVNMTYQISMRPRLGKTLDCTSGCS
ncbi:MAG: TadE/TadG family type IV pilus assembly protein [Pseudomonadota bacterium]